MAELPGLDLAVERTFRALAELDRDHRPIRRPRSFANLRAETGVAEQDLRRVLDRFRSDDCSSSSSSPGACLGRHDRRHRPRGPNSALNRMGGNPAAGDGGSKGWLWAEADDGNIYRGLLALAEGPAAKLPPIRSRGVGAGGTPSPEPRPGRPATAAAWNVCNACSTTAAAPLRRSANGRPKRNETAAFVPGQRSRPPQ